MKEKVIFGIVGFALGFLTMFVVPQDILNPQSKNTSNMHQMPDGSKMSNDGSMEGKMHNMVTGLEGKTGEEFDKAFISEMIFHHEGAVDMAEQVLVKSKRPELLQLANDIISAQTKEINMMKSWQTTWFK